MSDEAHRTTLQARWIAEARARADAFYRGGPKAPYTWVLNQGKHIPDGAIVVGREKSWTLYICRAFYKGSVSKYRIHII